MSKKSQPAPPERKNRVLYGVQFPEKWPDYRCLLWLYLFGNKLRVNPYWRPDIPGRPDSYTRDGNPSKNPYTGQGRFQHTVQLTDMFMPKMIEWHDWSKDVVRISGENDLVGITGCGTSGKSTGVAVDSFWYWACAPLETAVIFVSTTLDSSKKRIWKEFSRLYSGFARNTNFKEATMGSSPRPYVSPYRSDSPTKRDEAHGVYVSALQKKSDTDEEMEFIKGFHPRRIRIVADEMDSLREHGKALWDVFVDNLASGTREASFVALGNDPSLFNQLGELMQRVQGQPLNQSDKEWTSVHGLACLRLDAWDSPNIRDNNKWTGIIRQEDIDRIVGRKGENSPGAWIMLRGLHPPEGAESTVLSEAMFVRFRCREGVTWANDFISCAALDPAYGGDNCCIRRFDYGLDVRGVEKPEGTLNFAMGKLRVFWHPPVYLKIDAGNRDTPEEYQVAKQTMEFCKTHGIAPENFIGDATGTTGGCMAILRREWSPRVNECHFGGLASDMPISDEDPRKASEEYDRRVTEIWFSFREFVQADMMRGVDNKTAAQFCSRHFEIRNRKTRLETKEEMKNRGLPSPDEGDCTGAGVELLRRKGINASIKTPVKEKGRADLERRVESEDFDSRETYQEDFEVEESVYLG